jgi:hypothetical protein
MGVVETPIEDAALVELIVEGLRTAGFRPTRASQGVRLEGVGVGLGDHSVDLDISTVDIDGIRIVKLSSLLRSEPGTFDRASIACTRGNGACAVPKFDVVEVSSPDGRPTFKVRASLVLFADHLSAEELSRMTWLYLKETDAIDNELAEMLSNQ